MSINTMTVGELVAERPNRARVFERLGIDYCCGGKATLTEASRGRGLDPKAVAAALREADKDGPADERNWSQASAAELAAHIVDTHHAYLRRELPRLALLVDKVAQVHGATHAELAEVREVFRDLEAEIGAHLWKEENILFPMIRAMEQSGTLEASHCGSVANPIRVMEFEHDNAGQALARLRALTADYAPPADACNSYRALLEGLVGLEADLHEHIHKENNILFPKAAALEARLGQIRGRCAGCG